MRGPPQDYKLLVSVYLKDGKVLLGGDGKVATDVGCCCGGCTTCNNGNSPFGPDDDGHCWTSLNYCTFTFEGIQVPCDSQWAVLTTDCAQCGEEDCSPNESGSDTLDLETCEYSSTSPNCGECSWLQTVSELMVPCNACCFSNGACEELDASDCTTAGGTHFFARCADITCQGACCHTPAVIGGVCCYTPDNENAVCVYVSSADECHNVYDGSFQGFGRSCDEDVECTVTAQDDCDGTWFGYFTDCFNRNCGVTCCPQVSGACCVGGNCFLESVCSCFDSGGTFMGNGTSCSPNPCGGSSSMFKDDPFFQNN